MECKRCGLCCFDAPCGCGFGHIEDDGHCNYMTFIDNKAVCIGLETKNIKPEALRVGEGCGYYLREDGKYIKEDPKWARETLARNRYWLEEYKKTFAK